MTTKSTTEVIKMMMMKMMIEMISGGTYVDDDLDGVLTWHRCYHWSSNNKPKIRNKLQCTLDAFDKSPFEITTTMGVDFYFKIND